MWRPLIQQTSATLGTILLLLQILRITDTHVHVTARL